MKSLEPAVSVSVVLVSIALVWPAAASAVELVSPGVPWGAAGVSAVAGRCPTFSWAAEDGADDWAVSVYRLGSSEGSSLADSEESVIAESRPVLSAEVPGGARSWTANLPDCLEEGGEYAWTVARAADPAGSGTAAPLRRFSVARAGVPMEVAPRVLAVIGDLVETGALAPMDASRVLGALGLAVDSQAPDSWPSSGRMASGPEAPGSDRVDAEREDPQLLGISPAPNKRGIETTVTDSSSLGGAAAVRGTASVDSSAPIDISAVGVWGEVQCDAFYSCAGAGVYGSNSGDDYLPGVLGEGEPGVQGTSNRSDGVQGRSHTQYGSGGAFYNYFSGVALRAGGNGMGRDRAALVVDNSESTQGMGAYVTNGSGFATAHFANSGTGQVLYLQNGGSADGTGGGNFIEARSSNETDIQFRVASSGSVYSDGAFNGGGADFAEMLEVEGPAESGDVLVMGDGGRLRRSSRPFDSAVVGIVSTEPGFVGGSGARDDAEGRIPVAIVGIVPLQVSGENGAILIGDLLVTSSVPGHAMRAGDHPPQGAVVGKALEGFTGRVGSIRALALQQ